MKPTKNAYDSLRISGVRGRVVDRDYKSVTIFSSQKSSVSLLVGELCQDCWDYGYHIQGEETTELKKLPGEGCSWFRSEHEAMLCGLGELRTFFELGSLELEQIDLQICRLNTQSLFE